MTGNVGVRAGLTTDTWLSEQLAKPAWNVVGDLSAVAEGVRASGGMISAKIDVVDIDTNSRAATLGYQLISTDVRYSAPIDQVSSVLSSRGRLRDAATSDADGVRAIASEAFTHDRFHRDPRIDNRVASRIKAEWAANYFAGSRGDRMVVWEDESGCVQAFTLVIDDGDAVIIDLIAVSSSARSEGVGSAMIRYLVDDSGPSSATLTAGTQLVNFASLRFYARLGLGIVAAHHTWHLHLEGRTR